jgi:uncharacterized protein Yka (UPF0111/DUF47 family)
MDELAKLLLTASQRVYEAVTKLNKLSYPNLIDHSKTISKCEHEGDKIYRTAIAELFEQNDPIEMLLMLLRILP